MSCSGTAASRLISGGNGELAYPPALMSMLTYGILLTAVTKPGTSRCGQLPGSHLIEHDSPVQAQYARARDAHTGMAPVREQRLT